MKICYLCNEYPLVSKAGGLGSFVRDIGKELVKRGHEVTVVGIYRHPLREVLEDEGVRVVCLPGCSGGRVGFFQSRWRLSRWVVEKARQSKLDLVESGESGGWGLFIPKWVPLVVRFHNSIRYMVSMGWHSRRGLLINSAEDIAIRKSTGLIAVSEWAARRVRKDFRWANVRTRDIAVIRNGIDFGIYRLRDFEERIAGRIVFVGTIKPQKGIVTLLKAFDLVVSRNPNATLVVVGRDTQLNGRSYWEVAVEEARLSERTLQKIHRRDAVSSEKLPSIYGSASVCVFPSLAEAFGLVVAEAMACARPVVYSSTTVGPEVISNGVDGLLADPARPEEFANAILRILRDETFARSLAVRAAESARAKFAIARCAERSVSFYRSILRERNQKSLEA